MHRLTVAFALAACGSSPLAPADDVDGTPADVDGAPPAPIAPLAVRALGVQGFALGYGGDTVLTAPLFTRQSAVEVGLGVPLTADTAAIDAGLADVPLAELRAVVSGHAHYDHFLDVPHILASAPNAVAYTNRTGRNILAALAPDRPAGCTNNPARPLARDRVIALDDLLASRVDYTNCPALAPPGVPLAGAWVDVPGSHVRIMAFCSMHPDQIGPIHFGAGSIDDEPCDLPAAASGWLEGETLALLIDFVEADGRIAHRVFYQDAPTDAPIGLVPPAVLADHPVDLALLCVGSNDAVANEPTAIIENLSPRFVLSGHWEDFFQALGGTPRPIPFLDVDTYVQRAEAALAAPADRPLVVDGTPTSVRHVLVQPGTTFEVPAR